MLKKFLLILAVFVLFTDCSGKRTEYGSAQINVIDAMTDAPIAGAKVTVPETGESFFTDENGYTDRMRLPVVPDTEYGRLLEDGAGRITFIVRADGYTPFVLLYARIAPGCDRTIDVMLFDDDGTLPVFTIIEAPPAEWSEELMNKYG